MIGLRHADGLLMRWRRQRHATAIVLVMVAVGAGIRLPQIDHASAVAYGQASASVSPDAAREAVETFLSEVEEGSTASLARACDDLAPAARQALDHGEFGCPGGLALWFLYGGEDSQAPAWRSSEVLNVEPADPVDGAQTMSVTLRERFTDGSSRVRNAQVAFDVGDDQPRVLTPQLLSATLAPSYTVGTALAEVRREAAAAEKEAA